MPCLATGVLQSGLVFTVMRSPVCMIRVIPEGSKNSLSVFMASKETWYVSVWVCIFIYACACSMKMAKNVLAFTQYVYTQEKGI